MHRELPPLIHCDILRPLVLSSLQLNETCRFPTYTANELHQITNIFESYAENTIMTRSRILLITRNLPPLVGGMERLNWHMADELAKQANVEVIGPTGAADSKPESVTLTEAPLKPLSLFLLVALFKGLWICFRRKPNIILAGSGLTAPITWLLSKLCGARSAVYLHGFDIAVEHTLYRKLWRSTFQKLDHVIVNSTPTQVLAVEAGVSLSKVRIIYPGVSPPDAPQPAERISAFKAQHGLDCRKIMLSVGRLTTRKGLQEFVEHALPSIVQAEPEAVLAIVGEAPRNSLGAGIQTEESIKIQAEKSGVAAHIQFLGVITDKDRLATAYEAADVHVFPVRHIPDDPEGFGMVAIEAAAHGLSTVAFATGGVVDAVSEGVTGYLVERNNYPEFAAQVLKVLRHPMEQEGVQKFSHAFNWTHFGEKVWSGLSIVPEDSEPHRQAHAVTNLSSRVLKARKIELLLGLDKLSNQSTLRFLEVGCGSGGISHYFATHTKLQCEVTAVDVHDNRQIMDGYKFLKVNSTQLPFPDESFDIVITNHVIEHVGETSEQLRHIKEIGRVLSPGGQCYLAVPNRWMVTEPHYNLKFLSWLPRKMRSRYLRWAGKGEYYDCEPLELAKLERLLREARMHFENISIPATKITFQLEKQNSVAAKLLRKLPDSTLNPLKPYIPTLIYKLEPEHD